MIGHHTAFHFELAPEDIERLNALHCGRRSGPDPETFDMAIGFEDK